MWYKIEDLYYNIKSWFKYNFFNKNWHKILKSVNCARPWDYGYCQETLYHYLEYQADYFEKSQHFVGWERAVKEIRLCKSLLEIVMEKRDLLDFSCDRPKLKIYVNTRNAKRFIPYEGTCCVQYLDGGSLRVFRCHKFNKDFKLKEYNELTLC